MRCTALTALAVGLVAVCLGVTACTEAPPQPPTAPFVAYGEPADLEEDIDVIQSVSGNAHQAGNSGITATFNIAKYADGTVRGWYHALRRGRGGGHIRVRVECLHVVGNQAWATGTIVAAINPDNVGGPYTLRFLDNGEGPDAAVDEFGGLWLTGIDCETEPDVPMRQVAIGNLQVRG